MVSKLQMKWQKSVLEALSVEQWINRGHTNQWGWCAFSRVGLYTRPYI